MRYRAISFQYAWNCRRTVFLESGHIMNHQRTQFLEQGDIEEAMDAAHKNWR